MMEDKNELELIIGLAAGVGVDLDAVIGCLNNDFNSFGYKSFTINVTDTFKEPHLDLKEMHYLQRILVKMNICSMYRLENELQDYVARMAIQEIRNIRKEYRNKYNKRVFILNQLKTPEEVMLLKEIYARNFMMISIYSDEVSRVKNIKNKVNTESRGISNSVVPYTELFNKSMRSHVSNEYHELTNKIKNDFDEGVRYIVTKDQEEKLQVFDKNKVDYGQNLQNTFHLADYFVNMENFKMREGYQDQILRFVELLFRKNPFQEPNSDEYYMFMAQAASYRSTDKSRQVGCVLVNDKNEMISSGYNDVCKAGGGHYTSESEYDYRDFKVGENYNTNKISEITSKITDIVNQFYNNENKQSDKQVAMTLAVNKVLKQFTIDYMRATHAEMSAILDAARRGVAVKDAIAYVNTFPCHNCAKHLIAAGIKKIIFLHPYPKSSTFDMFSYELDADNTEHLIVQSFQGVSPEKYIYLFQLDKISRDNFMKDKYLVPSIPLFLECREPDRYLYLEEKVVASLQNS